MGIKAKVKKGIKLIMAQREKVMLTKVIRHSLSVSKDPVPPLTKEQKDQIDRYWGKFGLKVPYEWHQLFYAKTGRELPQFIAKTTFNRHVRPYMNDERLAGAWSDKAYLDKFITGVRTPTCVVRNVSGRFLDADFHLISLNEAQATMDRYDQLVIKPTIYTHTGHGVQLLTKPFDLQRLHREYRSNYVIQVPLVQHENLSLLNPSSVNTIRVNSVLLGEEAHIMSCFVKVGESGQFADNAGSNRYFIGIHVEDGTYFDYAIDHDMNRFSSIPSGYAFAGQPIPGFERLKDAVCRAHKCIPHFGLAFWDTCICEDGEPAIVEVNLRNPDSAIAQATGEPFLGQYTEAIFDYISERGAKTLLQ